MAKLQHFFRKISVLLQIKKILKFYFSISGTFINNISSKKRESSER